jgi:transposase
MVRNKSSAILDPWLDACFSSPIYSIQNFAAGIKQDYAAVKAALETDLSNAQTEGQVNRLKVLKRQMYGRTRLDLLRIRVLYPSRRTKLA